MLDHAFSKTQSIIIELINTFASEYDCCMEVTEIENDYALVIECDGERTVIGTISAVKSMTVRGVMGFFEEATMARKGRDGCSE